MPWLRDMWKSLVLLLIFFSPLASDAATPPVPEQPSGYVMDLAGVLDHNTRTRLQELLKELELQTTAQVVVLIIDSLEGEPIEQFSHRTAVKWALGRKGKDNGVLITVAVKDRKYRLEVGYGLEAVLPDSLVGSIGREYLVPNFRKGDFSAGILAAASAVAREIASPGETKTRPTATKEMPLASMMPAIIIFILFGSFWFMMVMNRRRRLKKAKGDGDTGGVWGGFWAGGGSGGGGGSSFGGGGGDFGGGGCSGDW
jgi:uncharacterized protein